MENSQAGETGWAEVAYSSRFWGKGSANVGVDRRKSGGGSATGWWDAGLCCKGLGFDRVVGSDFVALDVEGAMARQMSEISS